MKLIEIFLISIGLSMDSFTVSICKGFAIKESRIKNMLIIATYFMISHVLMITIGYFLGTSFREFIENADHWIAFLLLVVIGLNMIKNSRKDESENKNDKIDFKTMSLLALATSIDALVIGITFAFFEVNLLLTTIILGTIVFLLSILGVHIGNQLGDKLKVKPEFVGGLILMLIGFKILLQHIL